MSRNLPMDQRLALMTDFDQLAQIPMQISAALGREETWAELDQRLELLTRSVRELGAAIRTAKAEHPDEEAQT